jgi:GntR family transcriptional repressor for pyruvate dehydrogenase complex
MRTPPRRRRRVMKTSELIARDIILDIAQRGLKVGDSLPPEASMLQHYEVGRASLREALRLLEVNGLVYIRAGAKGGPVVGEADAEHLARMLALYFGLAGATYEDLTEVMLLVYPQVAEIAARRKLTKAQAEALRVSLAESCGDTTSRLSRSEILKDFHTLLADFSGNLVWSLLANSVALIFVDHIISTIDSTDFHEQSIADHREILDAVLGREPEAASKAMSEHTQRMIDFYRSMYPSIFTQLIEWR